MFSLLVAEAVAEPGKSNWEGQTVLNLVWEGQIIKMHCFNSKKVNVYTSIRPKPVTLGGARAPAASLSPPLYPTPVLESNEKKQVPIVL